MSNYSEDSACCRVDFFKPSGKWYTTDVVKFDYTEPCIHQAFKDALQAELGNSMLGMQVVCLEPYHKNSHPLSLIWQGLQTS